MEVQMIPCGFHGCPGFLHPCPIKGVSPRRGAVVFSGIVIPVRRARKGRGVVRIDEFDADH
ncbi:hypothetical protein, partial [Embleya sp. NPDC005971]|uniref:hypothetical protein n=1 Tax=Embleya sp. NPDC005971 TaxID=3156724 RepID=UPI0033D601FB